MANHKAEKPKIEKPEDIRINGETPAALGKKVRLIDLGKTMNEVVAEAKQKPKLADE